MTDILMSVSVPQARNRSRVTYFRRLAYVSARKAMTARKRVFAEIRDYAGPSGTDAFHFGRYTKYAGLALAVAGMVGALPVGFTIPAFVFGAGLLMQGVARHDARAHKQFMDYYDQCPGKRAGTPPVSCSMNWGQIARALPRVALT